MPELTQRMGEQRKPYAFRKRIIVHGNLVLMTPTHLGNGDADAPTAMSLQRDSISGAALLNGSSIAGALRNYLRARMHGDSVLEPKRVKDTNTPNGTAEWLFGGLKGADDGSQSALIVCDARSTTADPAIELRDGVRINAQTRTADDTGKYDFELLAAGTIFPLRFELRLAATASDDDEQRLRDGLAIALSGLEIDPITERAAGEINIGMKKRRGFGLCRVDGWEVWEFDLTAPDDLLRWLAFKRDFGAAFATAPMVARPAGLALHASNAAATDKRQRASLEATFTLVGSLLIRSGQDRAVLAPDVRHLHARQSDGNERPVISGTSLAGVLRHRAERIANTLRAGSGAGFTERLFGRMPAAERDDDMGQASRIIVHERIVRDDTEEKLVQNRIAVDRFTGGAYEGALFNAQPVFATPKTNTMLAIEIIDPQAAEVGMLLLLLKDLWTEDLPIGGESSIGRGRLHGRTARLRRSDLPDIIITEAAHGLRVEERVLREDGTFQMLEADRTALEQLITALQQALAIGGSVETTSSMRAG